MSTAGGAQRKNGSTSSASDAAAMGRGRTPGRSLLQHLHLCLMRPASIHLLLDLDMSTLQVVVDWLLLVTAICW
ncbi:unnamed protein product [Urochloa humidicola]